MISKHLPWQHNRENKPISGSPSLEISKMKPHEYKFSDILFWFHDQKRTQKYCYRGKNIKFITKHFYGIPRRMLFQRQYVGILLMMALADGTETAFYNILFCYISSLLNNFHKKMNIHCVYLSSTCIMFLLYAETSRIERYKYYKTNLVIAKMSAANCQSCSGKQMIVNCAVRLL